MHIISSRLSMCESCAAAKQCAVCTVTLGRTRFGGGSPSRQFGRVQRGH
jgi:hypothetical protein